MDIAGQPNPMWLNFILFFFQSITYQKLTNMIGKPRESKPSNALYEQVLTKNFEIIQTFLSQFHEIFQKQDEFEALVGKIEHRISLAERNSKKLEDIMLKSSDMYEKKMKSLKDFLLEKLKAAGDKLPSSSTHPSPYEPVPHELARESAEQDRQLSQQRKMEETLGEHMKKLEWQLGAVNQRISSLTALTNSLDERVGASIQLDSRRPDRKDSPQTEQLQAQLEARMEQLLDKVNGCAGLFRDELAALDRKLAAKCRELSTGLEEMKEGLKQKLGREEFGEFQATYKDDQTCMIRQVSESFANKKDTKRSLYLLEKKLVKLELMEQVGEGDENKLVVTPSSLAKKVKPTTLHAKRRENSRGEPENNTALNVRRLSYRKFNQERFL